MTAAVARGARLLALSACAWPAAARAAATFVVNNNDGAGEGFNDPTPAAAVGGNAGTTLGQQRMNVFNEATRIWGQLIDSPVAIYIDAQFGPLTCTPTRIVLGQARATGLVANAAGLPPNIFFPQPLAERIAGRDLDDGAADIDATFNGDLLGCSGGNQDWYYGFDGKAADAEIDLLSVILHELGHGLGFITGVDIDTGELSSGLVDSFTAHLFDDETNQLWSAMTDAQRLASAQNVRHLVWQGANVTQMAPQVLATGAPRLTPAPTLTGFSGALSEANFGPRLSAGSAQGSVIVGSPADGCGPAPNYTGRVVLFVGGDCPASMGASIAEAAGAVAILVADPAGIEPPSSVQDPPDQVAAFPTVHIPVIGVSANDANLLSGPSQETTTLDADNTRLVGADGQGRMYMYATSPIIDGSTVSHWDPLARPDLMQEPTASYTISHDLRMEAALMRDIGWAPFCGNGQIDPGEQCDNGAANSDALPGACRTTCVTAHCGDGVVDPGEQCDNGAANSDIAAGACRTTCVKAACGDGVVDPGEQCDNGAANAVGAACGADCTLPAASGDGSSDASGGGGGCKCAVGDSGAAHRSLFALAVGVAALVLASRRRRSRAPC